MSTLTNSYFTMASSFFRFCFCFFAAFIAGACKRLSVYSVLNPDLNKFNPVKGVPKNIWNQGLKTFLDFLKFLGIEL